MKGKVKPRLRKNPCVDSSGESLWQALAPKGWHFNTETSYCVDGGCVYLCLERDALPDTKGAD
jgi:hypothetical protein